MSQLNDPLPVSNPVDYGLLTETAIQYELDFCHHMIKLINCKAEPEEHLNIYKTRIALAEQELERRLLS